MGTAHGRVECRARFGLLGLAQLRLPQLHRSAESRHPAARAAPPRRALLQPARLRPQAGLAASVAAHAVELEAGFEALEAALASIGVVEGVRRGLFRGL